MKEVGNPQKQMHFQYLTICTCNHSQVHKLLESSPSHEVFSQFFYSCVVCHIILFLPLLQYQEWQKRKKVCCQSCGHWFKGQKGLSHHLTHFPICALTNGDKNVVVSKNIINNESLFLANGTIFSTSFFFRWIQWLDQSWFWQQPTFLIISFIYSISLAQCSIDFVLSR